MRVDVDRRRAKACLSGGDVGDVRPAGAARSASSRQLSSWCPGSATKARADLAAFLGADRDVLQVGVGRGQPAGRGRRHREGGVHAAGARVDLRLQRVGIGASSASRAGASRAPAPADRGPGRRAPRARRRRSHRRPSCPSCRPPRLSSSNRISPSCLGEPMLKAPPGEVVDRSPRAPRCARRNPGRGARARRGRP